MAKVYGSKIVSGGDRASSYVDPVAMERMRDLFAQAKGLYAPGGDFMKGTEAQIVRGKKRAVASGMQGLASAGLAGTSMMGGIGKKYEEEVAQPALAQASSARLSALSGLMQAEAGAEASMATRYTTTPQTRYSRPFASKPSQQPSQPQVQQAQPQQRQPAAPQRTQRALPNLGPSLTPARSTTGFSVHGAASTRSAKPAPRLSSYYTSLGESNPFWK